MGVAVGYLALLWLFAELMRWSLFWAVSTAYILAISTHFLLSRWVTFCAQDQAAAPQMKRFLVLAGVNYVITIAVTHLLHALLGINTYVSAMVAVGVTTAFGFVASKVWVFQPTTTRTNKAP